MNETMSNESPVRLCSVHEVEPDFPLPVVIEGMPPIAVYRIQDQFYATDNLCTHGQALLTDGCQQEGIIECPLHGGAFDIRSGQPTASPCRVVLKTYPVLQDGDDLFIASVAD